MSIGIENYPNTTPPSVDYEFNSIKDNPGDNSGTKVSKLTNDDIQQTFRKLLQLANITPNALPDNVTNGYQYIQALQAISGCMQPEGRTLLIGDTIDFTKSRFIHYSTAAGAGGFTLDLTNAVIGAELIINTSLSSSSGIVITVAAVVVVTSNPTAVNTSMTKLTYRFKYLGIVGGLAYISADEYGF